MRGGIRHPVFFAIHLAAGARRACHRPCSLQCDNNNEANPQQRTIALKYLSFYHLVN